MNFNLFVSICVIVFITFIALSFISPTLEKYRKYLIILIPAIFVILGLVIFKRSKNNQPDPIISKTIDDIENDFKEASDVASLKTRLADEKRDADIKKLKEITEIKDKNIRRQKLAELIG